MNAARRFVTIDDAFLLPPVDPPADCGRTNASLPRDSSGGPSPNPQVHKIGAVPQAGWLVRKSLRYHHGMPPS